jgi:hypothetical protein
VLVLWIVQYEARVHKRLRGSLLILLSTEDVQAATLASFHGDGAAAGGMFEIERGTAGLLSGSTSGGEEDDRQE